MLASDLPSPLSNGLLGGVVEDEDSLLQAARAEISFPDKMCHQQIVLRASSESATGQERKDEWTFSFDRVCVSSR